MHFSEEALPEGRRPQPILQYFKYDHLPERLRLVSKGFSDLAQVIWEEIPDSPEQTVALRKLLESKDAAVRAAL